MQPIFQLLYTALMLVTRMNVSQQCIIDVKPISEFVIANTCLCDAERCDTLQN